MRAANDYLQPDGTLRQIIGCDTEKFFYGELLTDADIAEIKRRLDGE
jgi:hypothetical protein